MRRRRRLILVAVLALVVVWAVGATVSLMGAANDLDDGRDAAQRAADQLDPSSLLEGTATAHLEEAADKLASAHDRIRSPFVTPLRVLPVVGRQVRSIDALSSTAGTVADAAADTLRRASAAAEQPVNDGPSRLAVLDELADAVRRARQRIAGLSLGPDEALFGRIDEARLELGDKVDDARRALADAQNALRTARALFGGPSRQLVIAANNAEMMSGSGMWLVGGVLTTNNGHIDLGPTSYLYEVADPPDDAVTVTDDDVYTQWNWIHPEREWRSLMPSPRLPISADLGRKMWAAAGQQPVDGVLVIDAVGLSELVGATGPVKVGSRTFDQKGILRELLHDQYKAFTVSRGDRVDALAEVADAVFTALDAGRFKTADLVTRLTHAVRGRHLMAWSPDTKLEQGWAAADMAGLMGPDSLMVSLLNRGGNKLDWFTHIDANIKTTHEGADTLTTVTVRVRNAVPDGEPAYVAGPFPGAGTVEGEYRGVLTLNAPGKARRLEMRGVNATLGGPDGYTQMIGGELRVPRGATAEVTITFRIRGAHGAMVVEPSARMPGVVWHYGSQRWTDDRARTVRW